MGHITSDLAVMDVPTARRVPIAIAAVMIAVTAIVAGTAIVAVTVIARMKKVVERATAGTAIVVSAVIRLVVNLFRTGSRALEACFLVD